MVYAGGMPTCSIIIPAHNEERYVADCLRSILEARSADTKEIIVVDNASTDRTATVASGIGGVRVVREERKGTSFARERGFREATGDLLVFVDADSRLHPGWIERGCRWFRNPSTVCVSGPYLCYDLGAFWNGLSLLYWWLFAVPASLITGTVAVGGGMIIRRTALEAAHGFDTSVTFYGDDTNIAKRLRSVGRVRFDPRLIIWSSARRFRKQGLLKTAWTYACNFVSQASTGTSVTTQHDDIR